MKLTDYYSFTSFTLKENMRTHKVKDDTKGGSSIFKGEGFKISKSSQWGEGLQHIAFGFKFLKVDPYLPDPLMDTQHTLTSAPNKLFQLN